VAVLGLFASGAGNSLPGLASPLGSQLLSAVQLDRSGQGQSTELAAAAGSAVTASGDAAQAGAEPVPTTATTPPATATSMAPTPVDRPIVAPANIPRVRLPGSRAARTAYAAGPKEGGVWAVVVGIDDYPGTDADLKAAVADARDVDSALAAYG